MTWKWQDCITCGTSIRLWCVETTPQCYACERRARVLAAKERWRTLLRKARRESGLARFERTHTRCVLEGRYRKRAWRVPGTREHGQWMTLSRRCDMLLAKMEQT